MSDWVDTNGCNTTPMVTAISGTVERRTYSDCSDDAEVVFYKVTDGPHVWDLLPNTTEVVVNFFETH